MLGLLAFLIALTERDKQAYGGAPQPRPGTGTVVRPGAAKPGVSLDQSGSIPPPPLPKPLPKEPSNGKPMPTLYVRRNFDRLVDSNYYGPKGFAEFVQSLFGVHENGNGQVVEIPYAGRLTRLAIQVAEHPVESIPAQNEPLNVGPVCRVHTIELDDEGLAMAQTGRNGWALPKKDIAMAHDACMALIPRDPMRLVVTRTPTGDSGVAYLYLPPAKGGWRWVEGHADLFGAKAPPAGPTTKPIT